MRLEATSSPPQPTEPPKPSNPEPVQVPAPDPEKGSTPPGDGSSDHPRQ
jgi:hypothetical protein